MNRAAMEEDMKRICIFGAGQAGVMVEKWLPKEYKVECYIDNNSEKHNQQINGRKILSMEEGLKLSPDVIIIAILNREAVSSIKKQIKESGFKGEVEDITVFRKYQDVRLATLRLIAQEIKDRKVKGDMAELGVFKGDFACVMNELFPDRDLHLFDTFEGFHEKDLIVEEQFGTKGMEHRDFSDTNIDLVKSKMKNPEKVHFYKGYFPDTYPDHMPKLALVSLDPDLYEPVYQGLKKFYPLLSSGGVILVHDYNSMQFPGVKKAVRKYADEEGIFVIPLMDMHGTAVILKP